MLSRRDSPLPLDAIRDLLGLARAMYASTPTREVVKRDQLASVGTKLKRALELGRSTVGTIGHRAAWNWAEEACRELGAVVSILDQTEPVVVAAVARVVGEREGGKPRPRKEER